MLQDCDWEEHPAEAILGTTLNQKVSISRSRLGERTYKTSLAIAHYAVSVQLIVKRKGLDLTEYGLVDASLVKRQRLEGDSKAPVSLQM